MSATSQSSDQGKTPAKKKAAKKQAVKKKAARSKATEELGPKCPKCTGCRWRVDQTRKNDRVWIRRRKCMTPGCGYEYNSMESGPPDKDYQG